MNLKDTKIFDLNFSKSPLPLVFDSPHSGRIYPLDFAFSCPFEILEKAEDNYVDELFESVPDYGGVLLCALFPRTYIDVNRAEDDIDPDLLSQRCFENASSDINPSQRSHAGIGLIRRIVRPGIAVYDRKLTISEIHQRIEKYYKPYHKQLENLIEDAHYRYGQVWHINCHSMPSKGGFSRNFSRPSFAPMPDFVLGDRDGTSCELDFTHALRDFLKNLGYSVAINNPYRGVELVRRYSEPATGRHSIQIEINKGLYWQEEQSAKSKKFNSLKGDIEKLIQFSAEYVSSNLSQMAAD